MNPVFKMRAKEDILKEKICAVKEKEFRLREKEKQLELLRTSLLAHKSGDLAEEVPIGLLRKKSSRESDKTNKENRDRFNIDRV